MKGFVAATACITALLLGATSAQANLIVTVNGQTVANQASGNVPFTVSTSSFSSSIASFGPYVMGNSERIDGGLQLTALGAGTLDVTVTLTNAPLLFWTENFLANQLTVFSGNWTLQQTLYIDPTNSGLMTNPVLYSGPNSASSPSTVGALTGPYSITEEFLITATMPGSASVGGNGGVHVPEPASMALLGVGLLGIGAVSRKRRT